jgi:hypothetical protein
MNIKFENLHTLISCEYPGEPQALLPFPWGQIPPRTFPPKGDEPGKPVGGGSSAAALAKVDKGGRLSKIFFSLSTLESGGESIYFSCRDRFKSRMGLTEFENPFGRKRFA